jgi:hypothetical protein
MNVIAAASLMPTDGTGENCDASRAASAFEAILLDVAFKPLAVSLGFFGESLVDSVARSVAGRSNDQLHAHLLALFERPE